MLEDCPDFREMAEYARTAHQHYAGLLAGCPIHQVPAFPDTSGITDDRIALRDALGTALRDQDTAAETMAATRPEQWADCTCAYKFYLGRDVPRVAAERYRTFIASLFASPNWRTHKRVRHCLWDLTIWTERGGMVPGPAPDFTTGVHIARPNR
jgi:hypothetical protein